MIFQFILIGPARYIFCSRWSAAPPWPWRRVTNADQVFTRDHLKFLRARMGPAACNLAPFDAV